MQPDKSPRGRPPGTGKDDYPHLLEVARLMLANPGMSWPRAINKIVHARKRWDATHDSVIGRLRRKRKVDGERATEQARAEVAVAAEARERQERERRVASRPTLREMAEAAGRSPPDWRWQGVAGGVYHGPFAFLNDPAFEEARQRHEEWRATFDRHSEAPRNAIELGKAPGLTMARNLADLKAQGLLPQTTFDPPAGLQRFADIMRTVERVEGVQRVVRQVEQFRWPKMPDMG